MFLDVIGWNEPATKTWTYTYNGDGLRTKKTAPDGTVTTFTWDQSGRLPILIAENDRNQRHPDTSTDQTECRSKTSNPTAAAATTTTTSSARPASSPTRAAPLPVRYTFNAYGKVTSSTGTATTPLGYAGQYTDNETGFQYLRARYYDPGTGQFLSRDPLAADTRSVYGYATGNPLDLLDATGATPQPPTVWTVEPEGQTTSPISHAEYQSYAHFVSDLNTSNCEHYREALAVEQQQSKKQALEARIASLIRWMKYADAANAPVSMVSDIINHTNLTRTVYLVACGNTSFRVQRTSLRTRR